MLHSAIRSPLRSPLQPVMNAVKSGGVAAPEPPLTNLAAWYRKGVGITEAAGAVSAWADQSGNARHLLQATGVNQPALQGDGTILFDGTSDWLRAVFTLNQPSTVYFRGKLKVWTDGRRLLGGGVNNAGELFCSTSTPTIALYSGNWGAAPNATLTLDTLSTICAVFNGASSVIQVDALTATTGNAGANNPGGINLSGQGDAGGNPARIQAWEALVYAAAHDATQRSEVREYLATVL